MMVREILSFIDDAETGGPFLTALLTHAAARNACVKIQVITPNALLPAYAPMYPFYLPESVVRQNATADVDRVRALVAWAGDRVDVSPAGGTRLADGHAPLRIADLIVIGDDTAWRSDWLRQRLTETLLLSTGTPLLLLPEARAFGAVNHAMLGWKASAQASRVLHDLVALAEPGALIEVVSIGREDEAIAGAHADVVTHLTRHGFAVETHRFDDDRSEAEQLRAFAVQQKVDLLAVGGFAHSRVREIMLGGVTHALIADPFLPVLMAH